MKSIYYRHIQSGDCYKLTPLPDVAEEDWNDMLDVVFSKHNELITEAEYELFFTDKEKMDIDVRCVGSHYVIGEIQMKWIDLDEAYEKNLMIGGSWDL